MSDHGGAVLGQNFTNEHVSADTAAHALLRGVVAVKEGPANAGLEVLPSGIALGVFQRWRVER